MDTKAKGNISSLMQRLDKTLNKHKSKNNVSYKDLKEVREKSMLKLKQGKNSIAFLKAPGQQDPFIEWGFHQGLQEISWHSVPCDGFNKNEECIVCNVVDSLKAEDFVKNRHIWAPIEQKIDHYAPVINMESAETIAEGPKWLRLPKSVMMVILDWLGNLEEDESEFYSEDEPQKIIITYDKSEVPAKQYTLDKKSMKAFATTDLKKWQEEIQPVNTFFISKKEEELKKIVDEYFSRIEETVSAALDNKTPDIVPVGEVSDEVVKKAKSKLDSLKLG